MTNALRTLGACTAALVLSIASPSLALVPIPADKDHAVSLDGTWRFKLEQAKGNYDHPEEWTKAIPVDNPEQFEPFYKSDYKESAGWHDIAVPGNWEIAGFSPATYNQPDNASGFYRLTFDVPKAWDGRRILINFDGVQNGAEIWCNGQPVKVDEPSWGRENYHEGGWTAFQADLTPAVKPGQKNLLALRVTKNTKSANLDSGDYFYLGGVHRNVTLFSVPKTHVKDVTVQTRLLPDNKAEVRVATDVASPAAGSKVLVKIDGIGQKEVAPGDDGRAQAVFTVDDPRLWSAEFPNLYPMTVQVQGEGDKPLHTVNRRVGIREVTIENGVFKVNGVPVKMTGICRHDNWPTTGTVGHEQMWRRDMELMKQSNINAIRTSHYPYGSGFYDLCDELGFYVIDEMAACWCPTDDPDMNPAWEQRARETVRRDKNHPSVVIWAVGNENKQGRNNVVAADVMKQLDPTRPRLISWHPASHGDVEFDDAHYTRPQTVAQHAADKRRAKWPKIYTENPNVWEARNGADYGSLDRWSHVLSRTWDEVWKHDTIPGSFLWEWQDRAVADKCEQKLYDYFPNTGINLVKVKGLVDGWRNPRPDLYHVKMVYAPLTIAPKSTTSGTSVLLDVSNRYSFTDLSTLKADWTLLKSGKELAKGNAAGLKLAPRTNGQVRLDGLPADPLATADTLRLNFDHPQGWNVVTYQLPLNSGPTPAPAPTVRASAGQTFPRLNLVTAEFKAGRIGWRTAFRTRGRLANVRVQTAAGEQTGDEAALASLKLAEVKQLDADVLLGEDAKPVGKLHASFDPSSGKFSYRVDWTGPKVDVQELGWAFTLPKSADQFSWDRQAVWSWYPGTHIGRPSGTARPDSANVELTKLSRPDAFDFNSTKYDCNWAALADTAGAGLCVTFPTGQRHHVRADFDRDAGTHLLVVNKQCSPPRDLSSNIVPDLYLNLAKGDKAEGTFSLTGLAR